MVFAFVLSIVGQLGRDAWSHVDRSDTINNTPSPPPTLVVRSLHSPQLRLHVVGQGASFPCPEQADEHHSQGK